jgi:hypothetical protein
VFRLQQYLRVHTGTRPGEKQEPVAKRKLHFGLLGSCICSFGSNWKNRPQGCGNWVCFCPQVKRWGSIYLVASGRKWQRLDLSISPSCLLPTLHLSPEDTKGSSFRNVAFFSELYVTGKMQKLSTESEMIPAGRKRGWRRVGRVAGRAGLMAIRGSTSLLLVESTDSSFILHGSDPVESHTHK